MCCRINDGTQDFTIFLDTSLYLSENLSESYSEDANVNAVIASDSVGKRTRKKTEEICIDLQQIKDCADSTEGKKKKKADQILSGLIHNSIF